MSEQFFARELAALERQKADAEAAGNADAVRLAEKRIAALQENAPSETTSEPVAPKAAASRSQTTRES